LAQDERMVLLGGMKSTPIQIVLTEPELEELQRRARSLVAPHREVVRAKIVLGLANGKTLLGLERELQITRKVVRKWGKRFERQRLAGLVDEPRSGRPARFCPRGGCPSGEAGLRAA